MLNWTTVFSSWQYKHLEACARAVSLTLFKYFCFHRKSNFWRRAGSVLLHTSLIVHSYCTDDLNVSHLHKTSCHVTSYFFSLGGLWVGPAHFNISTLFSCWNPCFVLLLEWIGGTSFRSFKFSPAINIAFDIFNPCEFILLDMNSLSHVMIAEVHNFYSVLLQQLRFIQFCCINLLIVLYIVF